MKKRLTFLLFLFSKIIWSQDLETRIESVENGLTFPVTNAPDKELIRTSLIERLEEDNIHGASVAVVYKGKLDWSRAYGVTEADGDIPVTTQTLFQCASIGKVITAFAVMNLVEAGKVDLDEDVNNKLQRWKINENEITKTEKVTLRHLLSHTSGLTDDYGFLGYDPSDEIPTLLQILNNDAVANTKKRLDVKTTPGKTERYSGGGYLIIQLLIEDVSGQTFADYVKQHIFEPLEMNHTTYNNEPDKNIEVIISAGHHSNGKSLKKKKYNVYPEKAATGPWTTAEDLAKLILGIQDALTGKPNAICNQQMAQELLKVQLNNKGLGVNLKGIEKPQAFWHAGQNLGYTALLYGLVEKGEGAVILLNSDGGERLMQEFITSVALQYDWPVMKAYQSIEIPKELQLDLAGKYISADQAYVLWIEIKNDVLVLRSSNSKKAYPLYRIRDTDYTFKDSQDYYRISFNFDNDSAILTYSQSIGKTIELQKAE